MDRRVLWVGPQILRVVRCLLRVNRSMNRKVLRVTRQILRVTSRVLRMEEECYEWHEKYYVLKKINASDQTNTASSRRACRMIISVLWVERQALRDKTNVMIWMNKKSTTWPDKDRNTTLWADKVRSLKWLYCGKNVWNSMNYFMVLWPIFFSCLPFISFKCFCRYWYMLQRFLLPLCN